MNRSERNYVRELSIIATQLCYDEDIIDKILDSSSVNEAQRWLITGRIRCCNRDLDLKNNRYRK